MEPNKFSKLQDKEFADKSVEIVRRAQERGINLRILGAMAVYLHVQNNPSVLERYVGLDRLGDGLPMFTDLDLMGYNRQFKEISKFFKEIDFVPDFYVNAIFGDRRNIYQHKDGVFDVDVFFNSLSFSHEVKFIENTGKGRLELDFPTITLTDITLEKLQIHQINRKDLIDLFALFSAHEVLEHHEQEVIDGAYISRILSSDWGFEYDARMNLNKLNTLTEGLQSKEKITPEEKDLALSRSGALISILDKTPKTREWEKRAKKGTSKPWYNEVDEVQR